MSKNHFNQIQIGKEQAENIARDLYNIEGEITALPGELDFNFKLQTSSDKFVLKISRPDIDIAFFEFQEKLLSHISEISKEKETPRMIADIKGISITKYKDAHGNNRWVRLYTWTEGRLWSSVNPQNDLLLYSLGKESGATTKFLLDFDHELAHREFDWDIYQADWTINHVGLFTDDTKKVIIHYQKRFLEVLPQLKKLRKGVIHNDINDNNIIVSTELINPNVKAIIDYGDAIYTSLINNLAVTIAYAIMNKPDPLQAALPIIKGYQKSFPLQEEELDVLYILVAMRLVISVTKSAINKREEPDNVYLLISEKPSLVLLKQWFELNEELVTYSFRDACGYVSNPEYVAFRKWANENSFSLKDLFPYLSFNKIQPVDMSVSSSWLGNKKEYSDNYQTSRKLKELQRKHPDSIIAGGYAEIRPFYTSNIYKKESNNGPDYRTVHLGVDFWVEEGTAVHALFPGTVYSICNNVGDKNYGPTLILKHEFEDDLVFYTLYGHLSHRSLILYNQGDKVKKGDLIAYVGNASENGNWPPHLHFQVILHMLGNKSDFPGVAYPNEVEVWKNISPDPNVLLKEDGLTRKVEKDNNNVIAFRKRHLGKSLSLSYDKPLKMVRGEGAYLIDETGRKYLDTINNVAHVGHEHPRVASAGQRQMALLNTNTRYLHENINDFAADLLNTFPKELSIVYFVNSGSEANELALRMAKVYTGQEDMIAVEVGYHGNTNACIDISSYKFDSQGGAGCPENTHIVPLPDIFRGIYQGNDAGEKYAAHVQEKIDFIQKKAKNVAAFICESIISCGGQIELPENYLRIAYKAVHDAGGLCIADEVQVGCGRVGSNFWGFQLHKVVPDIVTIGKPIGNGHPLAAVVCTQKVADAFANGMEYFNTFGGNPVSCAIGREVLNVIADENLQENALVVGNYLKEKLKELQKDFPIIGDVRGQGLFLGFELNKKNKEPLGEQASYLANRMKDLGTLMSTDGPDHNVLKIKPPMVFSKENTDELVARLRSVFNEDFMRYKYDA